MKKLKWVAILAALFSVVLLFGCRYMTEGEETDDSGDTGPHTGMMTVDNEYLYNTVNSVTITIFDPDRISATSITVYVYSSYDSTGFYLPLVSDGAGRFVGNLIVDTTMPTDSEVRRIYCISSYSVEVYYYDDNPETTVSKFLSVGAGGGNLGIINVSSSSVSSYSSVTVTLTDPDLIGQSMVYVNVKSSRDTGGISISLSGAGDGVFTGSFSVATSSGSGSIAVYTSDTVTIIYNDSSPATTVYGYVSVVI